MNNTIDYYDRNADDFIKGTISVDMTPIYARFVHYLPDHARILDLGCGSGRDTYYFLKHGYDVVPLDGSKELCGRAEQFLGIPVINKTFEETDFNEEFDAVWACASLLHVRKDDMEIVLKKVSSTLKPSGILYASYKYGNTERVKNGRHFSDYTENNLNEIFSKSTGFKYIEWWMSEDIRKDRDERWLNVICKKTESS